MLNHPIIMYFSSLQVIATFNTWSLTINKTVAIFYYLF